MKKLLCTTVLILTISFITAFSYETSIKAVLLHQNAWKQAAVNCNKNNYYKYSIYSARSLAVSNPEAYLQADTVWMNMIRIYPGWKSNYLARDRKLTESEWWKKVGGKINNSFLKDRSPGVFEWRGLNWIILLFQRIGSIYRSDVFKWKDFNWEEHRKNAVDLFDYYANAPKLNWLDNRLVFLWSAMKGLNWKIPYTSLAEVEYLKLLSEKKKVYLILTEDRRGYVAELIKDDVVLHDPLTGELIDDLAGKAVLVMNNKYVWYPLMERDDRNKDHGLKKVVEKYCEENKRPKLTEFEESILEDLKEGTKLKNETEFSWARLFAIRATNQNTWRSKPLRMLSAKLFPQRYNEDGNYSDSPYEQIALGMVITEMGNRLSPISAVWAQIVQENASNPRKAFKRLGEQYWELFHRTDTHSEFVYGVYYRCWLPNLDDKLISGLGDCIVEACNTMSALSLANLEEWEIYMTNWWMLERKNGHVICGAYTPYGNYSLSNGLFRTRDKSVLHGPLWDIYGKVAYNIIYNPKKGFLVFTQTKNAANFSKYETPFTNLSYDEAVTLLRHIETLERGCLIAVDYPAKAKTIDEYIEYISQKSDQWEKNRFNWSWR